MSDNLEDLLEPKKSKSELGNQLDLMDLLNKSPKTTHITSGHGITGEFSTYKKKIYRVAKAERFFLGDGMLQAEGIEWARFNKLLDSVDGGDIISINFSADLTRCIVIYQYEVKWVDKDEHDKFLPETDKVPNEELTSLQPEEAGEDLFSNIHTKGDLQ